MHSHDARRRNHRWFRHLQTSTTKLFIKSNNITHEVTNCSILVSSFVIDFFLQQANRQKTIVRHIIEYCQTVCSKKKVIRL